MQYLLRDVPINETLLMRESVSLYSLAISVRALKKYYLPVIVGIGGLTNMLNCIVFSRSGLRKSSCTPFIQALCMSDLLFLTVVFMLWMDAFHIKTLSEGFGCQAVTLFTSISTFIAVWMSVCIAVNRCVALDFPMLREQCSTALCSKFVVLAFSCSSVVIYVNISLLHASFVTSTNDSLCIPLPDYYNVIVTWNRVDAAVNFILPYSLMLVMVIVIARHLRYMCIRRRTFISTRDRRRMSAVATVRYSTRIEVHVTKMGLVVTLSFLLLNLPGHVLRLVVMVASGQEERSIVTNIRTFLLQQLFLYFYFTRAAFNFFPFFIVCKPYREFISTNLGMILERCRGNKHRYNTNSYMGKPYYSEENIRNPVTPTYRV